MRRVIVVGAGITGCFTAYFLARQGLSVQLVDPSGIGTHATANNPGGLNPLHGPEIPGIMSDLALRSFRLHQELQSEIAEMSDIDFEGHIVSRLEIALNGEEEQALKDAEPLYNATEGFSAEWLSPEALRSEEPRIGDSVQAALLTRGNGMVNGRNYARAVAAAGCKLGVELLKAEVTGIKRSKKRVEQVLTTGGDLPCEAVVFATGPWFEGPARWLNTPLPITPLKGQLLLAELPGPSLPHHITRGLAGIYAIPSGRVWLGGTKEDVGFNAAATADGRNTILTELEKFIPDISRATIVEQVAAFRPVTPDLLPIIGKNPNLNNAYAAGGAGVKGMLLSTGIAEAITAEITEQPSPISTTPFSSARFC